MQEIVVIDGEITLENVLDGEVELEAITDLDPEVVIGTGGAVYPHYTGSYTVTPSSSVQTLDTSDKVMDDDVTVQAVQAGSATTPATIITADPTISVSNGGLITSQVSKTQQITPTVQEGYVETGTPGNVGVAGSNTQQLSVQGAQTIHPSSSDQSISSGKYLTGAQTFKAVTVSGLTADKVLQGTTVEIGDSDDSDRIMKVVGTASGGITPTGTKSITANGTGIDVYSYQYADVAVPNSYSASDEGKVVSNGALVSQTSDTVTANDTYDTTLINSLTVNVSGGGGITWDSIIEQSYENTDVTYDGTTFTAPIAVLKIKINKLTLTNFTTGGTQWGQGGQWAEIYAPKLTKLGLYGLRDCSRMTTAYLPKLTNLGNNFGMSGCPNLVGIVLPSMTNKIVAGNFESDSKLKYGDFTGITEVANTAFNKCTIFDTLIIRNTDAVVPLVNVGAFNNSPFASGKSGGTLYVPSSLVSSYSSASNWSTILGYATNQIKSIESTHTDQTAPIDLTLYYADGTLIPTT